MTASARRICILVLLALSSSGCMFIDAGGREMNDHGSHAKYRHQSYGAHVVDSMFESDDEDCD
jgi:hypothetical protein